MLMFEGIYGFIMTLIFTFTKKKNPFQNIQIKGVLNYILFIIGLIFYFLLSGAYNSYRVAVNKLYSPITLSLTYCFLDPILFIYYEVIGYYYTSDEDNNNNDPNISLLDYNYIFIINIILSFFIVFFICIYNEIFVLFCFNLEKDTYHEISNRSYCEMIDTLSEEKEEQTN